MATGGGARAAARDAACAEGDFEYPRCNGGGSPKFEAGCVGNERVFPALLLTVLLPPPVIFGNSGSVGALVGPCFGLDGVLPFPAVAAAANALFPPEYVFTAVLALGAEGRLNAVDAPKSATF